MDRYIPVITKQYSCKVNIEDIVYIQQQQRKLAIVTDDETFVYYEKMDAAEDKKENCAGRKEEDTGKECGEGRQDCKEKKKGGRKQTVIWDLYCGIGTISLFLAQKGGKVYGVEVVPQAIDDARNNARINNIENVEFFVGKAEEVLPDYYREYEKKHGGKKAHADVIVVDPPRKGCEESLLRTMADMKPERIVYVSCDSATLARDVKYLREKGYEIERVRAVDQFPHTVHVETVCLLSNRKSKPDTHVKLSLSMDDYYRIKEEGKNNQ